MGNKTKGPAGPVVLEARPTGAVGASSTLAVGADVVGRTLLVVLVTEVATLNLSVAGGVGRCGVIVHTMSLA